MVEVELEEVVKDVFFVRFEQNRPVFLEHSLYRGILGQVFENRDACAVVAHSFRLNVDESLQYRFVFKHPQEQLLALL